MEQIHNCQQLTLKRQTKQTTRAGRESQLWRSFGGLPAGKGKVEDGGKVQRLRNIIGRYKIDGEVKNSIGNGEAKELICMTHGHELRQGNDGGRGDTGWRRIKKKKMG